MKNYIDSLNTLHTIMTNEPDRIVHNGTTYNIGSIVGEQEADRMDVYCKVQS